MIDWSDAALGDPVLDFVVATMWRGWSFVDEVLHHYDLPFDASCSARLDALAKILSVKWLIDAWNRDEDVEKHAAWVRNAFDGGPTRIA